MPYFLQPIFCPLSGSWLTTAWKEMLGKDLFFTYNVRSITPQCKMHASAGQALHNPTQLYMTEQIPFFHLRGAWAKIRLEELKYLFLNRFYYFLRAFANLRNVTIASLCLSVLLSVHVKQLISMKLDIWVFFVDMSKKWKFR